MSLEKTIIVLVVISFIFASANLFIFHVFFITREEAIEISRRTEFVQRYMERADAHTVEVEYLNQTQVNIMRTRAWFRKYVPKDSIVWRVTWSIHPENSPATVIVTHIIDAETGQILKEGALALR